LNSPAGRGTEINVIIERMKIICFVSEHQDIFYGVDSISGIIGNLSRSMTLLPGTREGVGFTRQPPLFLRDDYVASVEIERIGTLTNRVVTET
jgi:hypothetical protein